MKENISAKINIHTLGPKGTNCEAAALYWLEKNNINGSVILHDTLEKGMDSMRCDTEDSVLLGCVVYPELHNLVFNNKDVSEIVGCFVFPTMPMLLAARNELHEPGKIASHPAPVALIPDYFVDTILVNSNSVAAKFCADGVVDACITTEKAATDYGLIILQDYGQIPMGFTIHGKTDRNTRLFDS